MVNFKIKLDKAFNEEAYTSKDIIISNTLLCDIDDTKKLNKQLQKCDKTIIFLDVSGSIVDEETFQIISQFTQLQTLNLSNTSNVNSYLHYILRLQELQELFLDSTNTASQGVRYISALQRLQILNLQETYIIDDDLKYLQLLPNLEVLDISNNGITSQAIKYIKLFKKLVSLDISDTQITNEDHINQLRYIKFIYYN